MQGARIAEVEVFWLLYLSLLCGSSVLVMDPPNVGIEMTSRRSAPWPRALLAGGSFGGRMTPEP